MSKASFEALVELFQSAQALNDAAIEKLDAGVDLEALEGLFEAKAELLEHLEDLDLTALNGVKTASAGLFEAQAAQSRCAKSETRLAEALGRRRAQKNVNQVTKAYGKSFVDKLGINGLDLES